MARSECLFVNYVYFPPIGHVIEALHYCHGYHVANPDLRIALALNAHSPLELVGLCPYVDTLYPVRLDPADAAADAAGELARVPRTWDYVVSARHGDDPETISEFPGLSRYYEASRQHFAVSGAVGRAGYPPPKYAARQHFRLPVDPERPQDSGRPRIAILPAGGSRRAYYPSLASWQLILRRLVQRWPTVDFVVVGKLRSDGGTSTSLSEEELEVILNSVPRGQNAVDIPLIDQLKLVAGCDFLLSPHSGFGMATLAVGTPWLVIAGNLWPEYYFNGTPFYSVLPDIRRFPCFTGFGRAPWLIDDPEGQRTPSMSDARIAADLEEIVHGAERLVDGTLNYDAALTDHLARMRTLARRRRRWPFSSLAGGDQSGLFWSVDDVHLPPHRPGPA